MTKEEFIASLPERVRRDIDGFTWEGDSFRMNPLPDGKGGWGCRFERYNPDSKAWEPSGNLSALGGWPS